MREQAKRKNIMKTRQKIEKWNPTILCEM